MRRLPCCIAIFALVTLELPRDCFAGQATVEVKATVDQIIRILEDPAEKGPQHAAERREKIRQTVLSHYAFDEMAKRALGPTWNEITPAQRKQFIPLFTDLLERSYIARIEGYRGEQINYTGETVDGDFAEVHSTILGRAGDQTTIIYRLNRAGAAWQVYDLVIDGVSLVNNYRTQFGRIIRSSSYDDLVDRMKNKLESEQAEERAATHPAAPNNNNL